MSLAAGLELGFRTVTTEHEAEPLSLAGSLPDWLTGTLFRNGPAQFDVGGERVAHWFDGLAMLQRYSFDGTTVRYTNRRLRSDTFERARETGRIEGQFATDGSYLRRIWRMLRGDRTDNCNVHVARFDGDLVALTEVPEFLTVDPATLETTGNFSFADDLGGDLSMAHVVPDPHREETVGLLTDYGRPSTYRLFTLPDGSRTRQELAAIPTEKPAYVHSVGISADHVILTEHPFRVSPLSFFRPGGSGFVDFFDWEPERGTRFVVVHRDTGAIVAEHEAPASFVFHHVNAFEEPTDGGDADREIVLDLVDYPDASVIDGLYLEDLSAWFESGADGRLRRYRLPVASPDSADGPRSESVSPTQLASGMELPRVAPADRTQPYRYCFAQGSATSDGNEVLKVDVREGAVRSWSEAGLFVEEPLFVRDPASERPSDAGVVLVTALNVPAERTDLLVLDAETLTERARAPLPHAVPFGFHGRYFREF